MVHPITCQVFFDSFQGCLPRWLCVTNHLACQVTTHPPLPQVWSITYNSWLTFALLVWSCIIWMMRDRRRYAMMSAPFLAVYGTVLVVMGFMSALRLSRAELYPGLPLAVIGDFDLNSYYPVPCVHLAAKVRGGLAKIHGVPCLNVNK